MGAMAHFPYHYPIKEQPHYRWKGGLIIDNFAGGGGASTGIFKALGISPDIAVNHDAKALAMHAKNHPTTKHYNESVWDIDVRKATGGRPVLFGWFSPDCFPAGTLVLTMHGYVPIESLKVGDWVQTHKNRWRRVTTVMVSQKPVMTVRGRGHHGLRVSSEHPFYVRREKYAKRSEWVEAGELQAGHYWATPCGVENSNLLIPSVGGRGMDVGLELMRLAGYYVGNGWSRVTKTRGELVFTTHQGKADGLESWLRQWSPAGRKAQYNELSWCRRKTKTATQFSTSHRGLVEWLRDNFGHLAENKKVPGWLYQADEATRAAFLRGYLEADGYFKHGKHEATSVSKQLIYGLKMLATSLGKSVSVYAHHQNRVIEGREVNCQPSWCIRWLVQVQPGYEQTWRDEGMEWGKVKEVTAPEGMETVYNISVEEDESYVVEGIVVHNCTHFSGARGGTPVKKNIRGLAWIVKKWAGQSDMACFGIENVAEFKTWGPLIAKRDKATGRVIKMVATGKKDKKGRPSFKEVVSAPGEQVPYRDQALVPDKKRSGETFRKFCKQLEAMGYVMGFNDKAVAYDYGDGTIRKRLVGIGRKDGLPVDVNPKATHGDPRKPGFAESGLLPWVTAGEKLDFSLPCPSIFEPGRDLAEKTMERIFKGIDKFVKQAGDSAFLIKVNHTGYDQFRGQALDEPIATTTSKLGTALMQLITTIDHASTKDPSQPLSQPLSAVTSKARHVTVAAMLKHYTGVVGADLAQPAPTITATDHNALMQADLVEISPTEYHRSITGTESNHGELADIQTTGGPASHDDQGRRDSLENGQTKQRGQRETAPSSPDRSAIEQRLLDGSFFGAGESVSGECPQAGVPGTEWADTSGHGHKPPGRKQAQQPSGELGSGYQRGEPSPRFCQRPDETQDNQSSSPIQGSCGRVENAGIELEPDSRAVGDQPDHSVPGRHDEVRAFLTKWYATGAIGQPLDEPIHTIRAGDTFGLVTIKGVNYEIVDIGMRMLEPHELYACQGFPADYEHKHVGLEKPLSKADQVRMVGNSVPPGMACAFVQANVPPWALARDMEIAA